MKSTAKSSELRNRRFQKKGKRKMCRKWYVLGILIALSTLILSGCAESLAEEPLVEPEPAPIRLPDAAFARDAALAYVSERYDLAPVGLTWTEQDLTEEGLVGGSTLEYTAGDWTVRLSFAVVNPADTIYRVTVTNEATGFEWEGQVDAAGNVAETHDETVEWFGAARARDAVLAYVDADYGTTLAGLPWSEKDVTPGSPDKPLVGAAKLQYMAGDWTIRVSYPVVRPDLVVHSVTITNEATGFLWEGEVDATGRVTETTTPDGGQPVTGWYGCVVSLPAGSQYDDYLSLLPAGTGEIGVEGANESVEAEIVALRDKKEPGKYAHFWGTLNCPAVDYGGCQLKVTRLRVDGPGPFFDADPVEGWEGTIHSGPAGPRSGGDDYLVLSGAFPVQYGIDSLDAKLAARLESLRDTGTVVRVWGELMAGIPDWNGTQIKVNRIEAPEPPRPPEIKEGRVEGWIGTIGKLPWGSQFGTFFERDDGQRFGIHALDADAAVKQRIEMYQWTGAQVQVWGRSMTGIPDINGRRIEVERIEVLSGPEEGARNLAFFASASASSVLPSDRWGTYHAWSAIDDRLDSPWTEGVAGPGIGEWVMLTFPGKIEVWGIGLDIGYDRDADLFRANNRIKRAVLIFSNGEEVEVALSDRQGMQMTALARAPGPSIETTYVKVVIKEVYPGTRYDDTCLGEIEVLGRTK